MHLCLVLISFVPNPTKIEKYRASKITNQKFCVAFLVTFLFLLICCIMNMTYDNCAVCDGPIETICANII